MKEGPKLPEVFFQVDDADLRAVFNMIGDNTTAEVSVDPLSTIRTSRFV